MGTHRKIIRKTQRWLRKAWRRPGRERRAVIAVSLLAILVTGMIYNLISMKPHINPTAYEPLLSTIAKGESNGNYNAHFGAASNQAIRFTEMPVKEVLRWQDEYVAAGNASSAVGKYQIVRTTLRGLVQELNLDTQQKFNETLQDRLAITLLERRGVLDYAADKLSREEFAANLAKEWAALPRVIGGNPEESYYASDGLNKARISTAEMFQSLDTFRQQIG